MSLEEEMMEAAGEIEVRGLSFDESAAALKEHVDGVAFVTPPDPDGPVPPDPDPDPEE